MTTALRHDRTAAPSRAVAGWKIGLARSILFWERLWPAMLPIAAPVVAIAIAGLYGLWLIAPAGWHLAALGIAALLSAAALAWFGRDVSWPSRPEVLRRLEADGRLRHTPLQALEDRPFAADPAGPLWQAHLADMARRAAGARIAGPRSRANARDPYALRFAAIGLFVAGLVVAGPERGARLAGAFLPAASFPERTAAADLWIEPPGYTGKAPIYLLKSGERVAGSRAQIDAPEGSLVVVQTGEKRRVRLRLATEDGMIEGGADTARKGRASLTLARSGLLRLKTEGAEGRWPIGVIADDPPAAHFIEDPSATDDARLAIALAVEDDYGVASARLTLRLDPDQERPLDAPEFDATAVRDERVIAIDGVEGKAGDRRFDLDLQADPWAGLVALVRVTVIDGAGQEGATGETSVRLPARPFYNPLARAVVEQRQTLAVAESDWSRAGRSLDALTLAPDRFYEASTDYLLMRTAFWRVMRQDGEGFSEAVRDFWPLALQLEDEALELARRRLEAAQEKLREALERDAGDDEIAGLVDELRAAMQQYLQALAQSGERSAEAGGESAEAIDQGDLDDMLEQIRDLAKGGAKNAARQALSDLENILENLRMSSRGGGGEGQGRGQGGEGGGLSGAAGDLIGRQRDLANRSFEQGQSPDAAGGELAGEEKGLADDLAKLLDSLSAGGEGADPEGEGKRALGEALAAMRDAEGALRSDDFDAASTAMERAIEGLRDGAQAMAKAEGRAGERMGEGEGAGNGLDPLGRPIGDANGRGVEVPEAWDAQRARDVLKELRRRLSEGERNDDEIRYLERLLERF